MAYVLSWSKYSWYFLSRLIWLVEMLSAALSLRITVVYDLNNLFIRQTAVIVGRKSPSDIIHMFLDNFSAFIRLFRGKEYFGGKSGLGK